jgi:chromosome segregation ATPase
MPRKKTLPPTTSQLNAVVTALAKENARLKAELDEVQEDLSDTVDRMLANERNEKKTQTAAQKELEELHREIDGKNPASKDPQWYITRLRIMKSQLEKMRTQVARLERICTENDINIDDDGEEQVA